MAEHKVTVSGLYRPGWSRAPALDRPLPLLQLGGLAEEAGLYPGCQVRVLTEEGRLMMVVKGYEDTFGVEG